jgi:curved DNA-binding protein CbpA
MRTYYDVLGVAPDTPDVVIKAAYRALAKEYHPDGTNASMDSADRFIEIQTAYAVLSKPNSRSEYDAELQEALAFSPSPVATAEASGSLPTAPWQPVPQGKADIERICARLALYSEPLAQSFYAAYLRGECADAPQRFAEEMEASFFREYFGQDPDMQGLARLLLLGGRTGAAFTLNQLVAGGTDPAGKNLRTILPMLLDQHFEGEALFIEWLRVKFGVNPVEPPPAEMAKVVEVATAAEARPAVAAEAVSTPPEQGEAVQRSTVLRPLGLIIMWAIALYFALFAALPLLQ